MHGNVGPTEGIEPPEMGDNPFGDVIRIAMARAGRKVIAIEMRERALGTAVEAVQRIDIDYDDNTTEAEIDAHAARTGRFLCGLADALAAYLVTGEVAPLPDDMSAGSIDGE